MACKWYAEYEGICCNGDCPGCADICPYEDEQSECEYYESEGDVNETFYVEEAVYRMPYHELDDIRAFVRNHEWEDIPESIKEHLEKWEEFLIDNL